MGARGPAKSPSLKVVRGEGVVLEQPRGTAAAEVQPGMPNKPKRVRDNAALSALWDDLVPGMARSGLLAEADTSAVVEMLVHLDLSLQAYEEMVRDGITIPQREDKPELGNKKHPADLVLRGHSDYVLKYSIQLGNTWMARARTEVPKGDGDSGNPFGAEAIG